MTNQIDSADGIPHKDADRPLPSTVRTDGGVNAPSPSTPEPVAPGTDAARNEERRTPPARTRGESAV